MQNRHPAGGQNLANTEKNKRCAHFEATEEIKKGKKEVSTTGYLVEVSAKFKVERGGIEQM